VVRARLTVAVAAATLGFLGSVASANAPQQRWVRQPAPGVAAHRGNALSGISCSSGRACMAVGFSTSVANTLTTLAERWDGTQWRIVPSPNAPSTQNELNSVSCAAASACVAVGASGHGTSSIPTLEIQNWDGSIWTLQSAPSPADTHQSSLTGVSCPSRTDCTAVGFYVTVVDTRQRTLVEHWNGTRWKLERVPAGGPLVSVSCTSSTFCMAIGNQLERWNGRRWRIMRSLAYGGWNSVSCSSSKACMAVGDGSHALRWTGSEWVAEPLPPGHPAYYEGVSCVSARNCTAVGQSFALNTEAAWWDGTRWLFQTTPTPVQHHSALTAVSCGAGTLCRADGYALYRPLVERRS
jgi:hypothetical protein